MRLLILRTCCVIERSIYIVQLILDELTQAFAVGFNFIGNDSILRGFGWMIISLFVMLKKARESTYLEFGDGKDENCRWCGDGGDLICCDSCSNTFCKGCIKRNLGRSFLHSIEELNDDDSWNCLVCNSSVLVPLQQECLGVC